MRAQPLDAPCVCLYNVTCFGFTGHTTLNHTRRLFVWVRAEYCLIGDLNSHVQVVSPLDKFSTLEFFRMGMRHRVRLSFSQINVPWNKWVIRQSDRWHLVIVVRVKFRLRTSHLPPPALCSSTLNPWQHTCHCSSKPAGDWRNHLIGKWKL